MNINTMIDIFIFGSIGILCIYIHIKCIYWLGFLAGREEIEPAPEFNYYEMREYILK